MGYEVNGLLSMLRQSIGDGSLSFLCMREKERDPMPSSMIATH